MVNYHLTIDKREQDRISKGMNFFDKYDECLSIDTKTLYSADFVFENENGTVGFEYKTADDLISSIIDHRVFVECAEMKQKYDYSFLIIEGNIEYGLQHHYYLTEKNFTKAQVKGAFRRVRCICPIIIAENPNKHDKSKADKNLYKYCFDEMHEQALKCLDGKAPYMRILKAKKDKNPVITLLMLIKGVSKSTAENIVESLSLETQADYFNMTKEDLLSVEGIGEKKAQQIIKARGEWLDE